MGQLLFSFSGRLPRLRYFLLSLVTIALVGAAAAVLAVAIFATGARIGSLAMIGSAVIVLAASIVGLSLSVRRLHDLDLSGWWVLAIWLGPSVVEGVVIGLAGNPKLGNALSGVIGLAVVLWLWLSPGTRGTNRFGQPAT
jgi:uncharacterized membrane protein YhaH (DUF805 family)